MFCEKYGELGKWEIQLHSDNCCVLTHEPKPKPEPKPEPKHICAEVFYESPEGNVHSDLCIEDISGNFHIDTDYRKFLHDNLDEWLNNSNGTGHFVVGIESIKKDLES